MKSSIQFPLVTIITPTYNRANFLDETIQSVLSQDYPSIEYIILDDGSKDNTHEILSKYNDKVFWETHINMGETLTVNKGVMMARGEIICVVNSDDPLLPGAISTAVNYLQQNPWALVAYPDWLEIDTYSNPIKYHNLPDYNLQNMLVEFNVSIGPGTFIRKSAFEIIGMRDPNVKYIGDLEYWFRIAGFNGLLHIPHALATHRTHSTSASSTAQGQQMANEVALIIKKLYRKKALPKWVSGLKNRSASIAHHEAIFYCGTNQTEVLKHRLASCFYNPLVYIYLCAFGIESPVRSKIFLFIWRILKKLGAKNPQEYLNQYRKIKYNMDIQTPKFGFISHVLPPSWSGQAVVIERLLRSIPPTTYCLISTHDYQTQTPQENNRRLPGNYYSLPNEKQAFSGSRFKIFRWLNAFYKIFYRGINIAQIARSEKCKVLFVGTGDLIDIPATFFASILSKSQFIPYLFDDYTYQWTNPADRLLAKWMEKLIFPQAAKIIVPNEFLRDEIIHRHNIIPVIIRNPSEEISTVSKKHRHNTNSGDKEYKIVYTGAIYHVNFEAIRNVISAISKIKSINVKLHIYTAQPLAWLEKEGITGEHVIYHQHVPPNEVASAQANADMLLIPFSANSSVPEIIKTSAPGKLGDYLASGTPILAHVPQDSFVHWYLTKYQCGIVIVKNNPEIIATEFINFLSKTDYVHTITNNATLRAKIDFSPNTSQYTFMKILEFLQ